MVIHKTTKKVSKDLFFLLNLTSTQIIDGIYKYLIKQGQGYTFQDIKTPFTVDVSLEKYDYNGLLIEKFHRKYVSKQNSQLQHGDKLDKIDRAIQSMKEKQKAWFNMQATQKDQLAQGYHYQIEAGEVTFKDGQNFQSKVKVYEVNRTRAAQAFIKGHYRKATKLYIYLINILSHLSKKIYSTEQLQVLNEYRTKSQNNLLKCIARMCGVAGRYEVALGQLAQKISSYNLEKNPDSLISFYQRAAYFNYSCRFSDAQQMIREALKKKAVQDAIEDVQQRNSLKSFLEKVKQDRQRQVRHLKRQEKRAKKYKLLGVSGWEEQQNQTTAW